MLELDEGTLASMLAFEGKVTNCYVSDATSGVWRRTDGPKYHDAFYAMAQLADRMDRVVMEPLKGMIRRQHAELRKALAEGGAPTELERLQAARLESEDHLRELVQLYERLRKVSHQQAVMERVITARLVSTRDEGVTEDVLDTAKDCVAFLDGVYCFR